MENENELEVLEEAQEVVPEEEVKEEVPVEEPEPEPITYSSSYLEAIENARADFLKIYRTQNVLKWVVSFIAIAAVIVGAVVIPNLGIENSLYIMIGMLVGALALTILFTVFARKYIRQKMNAYFNLYYKNINDFVFGDIASDLQAQFPGKIQSDAFLDNNLYKDVVDVGSRGLTEFVYNKVPVAVADAAAQIRKDKRLYPAFVGKYLYAGASYKYDDPLYIYFKGDKRALPPTNLDGVKVVSEDKKMIIYSENKEWKKVINSDVKKILTSIEMNKELVDLSISLQKGRIFVCMGYDDPLMVLPLQQQFDPKPTEIFKKDVVKVLKLIEEFNK